MYSIILKTSGQSLFPMELVKQYIKVDGNDDDQIVALSLKFAEFYAYQVTKIAISPRTYNINTDEISEGYIKIRLHPVKKVIKVNYMGMELNSTDYSVLNDRIELYRPQNGVYSIEIECGYATLEEVKPDLQTAVLSHAAYHYNNRLNENGPLVPNEVQCIYQALRFTNIV